MPLVPEITFRRVRPTAALDADVRKRLGKLETFCPSLLAAHVRIEPSGRHHRDGNRYDVRIDLAVPGERIAISHQATARAADRALAATRTRKQDETRPAQKQLSVAVHEAFAAARRRLQDYVRRQRGD